jgi:hypothetical protein
MLPTLILMGLLGGLPAGALVAVPTTVLQPETRGPGMEFFCTWYYLRMTVLPPVASWLQAVRLYFAGASFLVTLPCWIAFRTVAQPSLR